MSDTNERSVASDGSVAGEFVGRARAWRDQRGYPTAGEMLDEAVAEITRLRLTDAEREAVKRASETLRYLQADYGQTQTEQDAATLLGLLERTK